MLDLTETELTALEGGLGPVGLILLPFAAGAVVAAAGYVGKDIYDNWASFKKAIADGWNAV